MVESSASKEVLLAGDGLPSAQPSPVKRHSHLATSKHRNAYCAHAPEPYAAMASRGDWSTELWDVCAQPGGPNLCCLSLWCPCIQYGLLLEQLPPGSVTCAGSVVGSCALFCALWLLGDLLGAALLKIMPLPCTALVHAQTRGHVRQKYGIQSHPLHDFFITWCCAPCALCQEAREVVIRQAAEREGSSHRVKSPSRGGSTHGLPDSGHRTPAPAPAPAPGERPHGCDKSVGAGGPMKSPFANGGSSGGGGLGAAVAPPPPQPPGGGHGAAAHAVVRATGEAALPPLAPAPVSAQVGTSPPLSPPPHVPPRAGHAIASVAAVSHSGGGGSPGQGAVAGAVAGHSPNALVIRPTRPD